jgi:hypothetical protein
MRNPLVISIAVLENVHPDAGELIRDSFSTLIIGLDGTRNRTLIQGRGRQLQ